jgi:chemotaxis protein MotB
MARRHRHEEHENHERWLVSYADFITLLFAFFVVMYAISSVNEGKYRVLSDSLENTFGESPPQTLEPIQVGELARMPEVDLADPHADRKESSEPPIIKLEGPGLKPVPIQDGDPGAVNEQRKQKNIDRIAEELTQALSPLIEAELIEVRKKDKWVEVEMKSHVLFEIGSARLSATAIPLLGRLAQVLSRFGNPIRVEGFTDDIPISTPVYPSNWELSAARAASVVNLFSTQSIYPERMAAIGYGEQRPIADNNTNEGRQKNRRVVIVVSAEETARQRQVADPVNNGHQAKENPAARRQNLPVAEGNARPMAQPLALPNDLGAGQAAR